MGVDGLFISEAIVCTRADWTLTRACTHWLFSRDCYNASSIFTSSPVAFLPLPPSCRNSQSYGLTLEQTLTNLTVFPSTITHYSTWRVSSSHSLFGTLTQRTTTTIITTITTTTATIHSTTISRHRRNKHSILRFSQHERQQSIHRTHSIRSLHGARGQLLTCPDELAPILTIVDSFIAACRVSVEKEIILRLAQREDCDEGRCHRAP